MKRILIAEDDASTRLVIGTLVADVGYIPLYSADGQHAYETLLIDPGIVLLITDVMMPRLDGRTLIKTLREHAALRTLPVIVISSVVGPKEIGGLMNLGASRFMPKPIDLRTLQEDIAALLGSPTR